MTNCYRIMKTIRSYIVLMSLALGLCVPAFSQEALRLGEIKPQGWIREQMVRDLSSGYISQEWLWQPAIRAHAFGAAKVKNYEIGEDGRRILKKASWGPGENDGYYVEAVVRNAFLTDFAPWIQKAEYQVDNLLKNQDKDGYIGIYAAGDRLGDIRGENGDLWTQSRALCGLLAYYEFTGEKKYLKAVVKAVENTMKSFPEGYSYFVQEEELGPGTGHGLMYVDVLEWLYRLTGDAKYPAFAERLYDDYCHAKEDFRFRDNQKAKLLDRHTLFQDHGVHVVEHFRVPLWMSELHADDPTWSQAIENLFEKLSKSLAPSGAIVTDRSVYESVAGNYGSGNLPYEYCTITELLQSYASGFEKLNRAEFGDCAERLVFNAGQGARFSDGKAMSYLTSDNRESCRESDNFRYQYTARNKITCCNLQAAKLMTYYVSNMWKKTDEGLVAFLYGPCSVNTTLGKTRVSIEEKTLYPMDNRVTLDLQISGSRSFKIVLREPSWSAGKSRVSAEGATISREDGFIILEKSWETGDRITIDFYDPVRVERLFNNEVVFYKGCLLYARPYDYRLVATKQFRDGYANYDVLPEGATPRLYFPSRDFRRQAESGDVFVFRQDPDWNPRYPYDTPFGHITGYMLTEKGTKEKIDLVPIGSTVLRQATFEESKYNKKNR